MNFNNIGLDYIRSLYIDHNFPKSETSDYLKRIYPGQKGLPDITSDEVNIHREILEDITSDEEELVADEDLEDITLEEEEEKKHLIMIFQMMKKKKELF
uniref:Uncharacterized protein n=1 Tax=Romanomermis culicivorax TaxID=13658 RepID=A0A915KAJ4_ROMCU